MVTVTTIAQRVLDENGYTTSDISLINLEYLIGNSVEYVNAEIGLSLTFTPGTGTESLTGTAAQILAIKELSSLMIRAYKEKGGGSAGPMTLTTLTTDPHYTLMSSIVRSIMNRLRTRSLERV